MRRKLIILSHDAMVREDIWAEADSPAFSTMLREGSWVETTRTIWPSITYPAHSSIISGQYPDKHGVYHNDHYTPDDPDLRWNWDAKYFKGTSLFEVAKKAGLSTACVFWPVTGNHPYIDRLIAEYWPQTPDETFEDAHRSMGTDEDVIRAIMEPNAPGDYAFLRAHPDADQFVIDCACDMIRRYKPDVLAIHPADIDANRHKNGVFSKPVRDAVKRAADWTEQIFNACREAGTFDDTVFVVMSDHGQIDLARIMSPNVFFRRKGLLTVNEDGSFGDWTCYLRSTGITAEIHVKGKDATDAAGRAAYEENLKKTRAALEELKADPRFAIDRILTTEEIEREEHLNGPFSFFIVGSGEVAYSNTTAGELEMKFDTSQFQTAYATHGMDPDTGPQPTALFMGPGVKKGVRIPRRPIVDIAPTCAALLGLELPDADGSAIEEILSDGAAKKMPRIYGVTGRSGSGKSRFARLLAEKLGCECVDIDRIGHACIEDPAIKKAIREHFGDSCFDADGNVIRKAVGKIVFASEARMEEYVGMTRDFIVRSLDDVVARTETDAVVFEWVRLPVTPKYWDLSSPKSLVEADREKRKAIVIARDGITPEYFDDRDASALDYDTYTYDFTVENDYRPETLEEAVDRIIAQTDQTKGARK